MRYWLATLVGLALAAVAIAAAAWGLYGLVRTGTCASGGAYQVVQPCPEGTGLRAGALVGGIFGTLLAIFIYALRGRSGNPNRGAAGLMAYGLMMFALSAASLVAAFGPASSDRADSKTGAAIVAFVLLPLGLPGLIGGLRKRGPSMMSRISSFPGASMSTVAQTPSVMRTPSPPPAPTPSGNRTTDSLARLEQLQALRASGAITEAEFAAKKAEILREM